MAEGTQTKVLMDGEGETGHTVPSPDVKGNAKHDVPLAHAVVANTPFAHSANIVPAQETAPSVVHVEFDVAFPDASNCLFKA